MRHLITGPKSAGGVGASTFLASIAELQRHNCPGLKIGAADGNEEVGKFFVRLCKKDEEGKPLPEQCLTTGAKKYSFLGSADISDFAACLEDKYDALVMDLPGGSVGRFTNLTSAISASELIYWTKKLEISLSIVTVITPMVSSLYSLRSIIDAFGNNANYVVVKNLAFGRTSDFKIWNKEEQVSKTSPKEHIRDLFDRMGGIEINMPAMPMDTYALVDAFGLGFIDGLKSDQLKWEHRANLRGWLNKFITELKPAAEALGLQNLENWNCDV